MSTIYASQYRWQYWKSETEKPVFCLKISFEPIYFGDRIIFAQRIQVSSKINRLWSVMCLNAQRPCSL